VVFVNFRLGSRLADAFVLVLPKQTFIRGVTHCVPSAGQLVSGAGSLLALRSTVMPFLRSKTRPYHLK
jgi:hypothetical protein